MEAMQFDRARVVKAVAARAFGGGLDVRPLLPEYEAEIGAMMAANVPPEHRPQNWNTLPSNCIAHRGGKRSTARRDEAVKLKGLGLSVDQIAGVMGITRTSARDYLREAARMDRK